MTVLAELPLAGRHALGARAPARWLHPAAWWLWAIGLAAAATQTRNPLVLVLLIAAAAVVVDARRPAAPWARSFWFFLALGGVVIVIRVVTQMIFGAPTGGTVLFTLPEIGLPDWLAGITLGGPVTVTALLIGLVEGLRLAALLACLGAASSLASPSRMLKSVPAALYEVGVAVVVTLTFAPQLVSDVVRVRRAQRLRGRPVSGLRGWWSSTIPVVNGSLERSIALAAAMDSRGYGRTAEVPRHVRAITSILLIGGAFVVLLGIYGLLSGGWFAQFGPWLALGGTVAAAAGLLLAGRRGLRTHYRPDPWALPEWLVAGSGVAIATVFALAAGQPGSVLVTPLSPPAVPVLSLPVLAAVLLAMLPAVVAPPLPAAVRR